MEKEENILGTEKISKLIKRFSIPCIISLLVNSLYNIVDQIFIGWGVGYLGNGATNVVFPLTMVCLAFALMFGDGASAYLSLKLGEKKKEEASKGVANGILISIIISVLLCVGILIFLPQLLNVFGCTENLEKYAVPYGGIIAIGLPFMMIGTTLNSIIRADGNKKYEMISMVSGAILNTILDPIFIFVFNMGVRGAALATVLSQAVGAVWILHFLTGNKTILRLKKANLRLDAKIIGPCLALGISTFVMLSTESILSISFTSSLSRYGGDLAVGAMTIITSTNQLIVMPLQGICQGGQPVISYNYGAKNNDRVKKAFFTQFKACVIFTCISWAIMMLTPQLFAGIFTSDKVLVNYTAWALRIYMAGIFAMGFQVSCQQSFMALGQAKVSLILACLRKLILLIPLIFILPLIFQDKVFAVFLAEPVSDIIAAIVTTIVFMFKFNNILSENE